MINLVFVESESELVKAIADDAIEYTFKPTNDTYFFSYFKVTKTSKSIFMEIEIREDAKIKGNNFFSKLEKNIVCEYSKDKINTFSDIQLNGLDHICFVLNAISVEQKELLSLGALKLVYDTLQIQLSIKALKIFQDQQQKLEEHLNGIHTTKKRSSLPPQKDINKFTKFKPGKKPKQPSTNIDNPIDGDLAPRQTSNQF